MSEPETGCSPDGYCLCGCGGRTAISKQTRTKNGKILARRGEYRGYLMGHATRLVARPTREQRIASIEAKTERDPATGCWNWTGAMSERYGSVNFVGMRGNAHRVYWRLARGDLPPDIVLDHLCRNLRCINLDHLEPVTQKENVLRGYRHRREGGQ